MKNWSEMKTEERDIWENKALNLIYPDLRRSYNRHDDMIRELAKGLYKAHVLSFEGGGEHQDGTQYVKSILDR